jgi:uncharacterized damage-inducible protein DinB
MRASLVQAWQTNNQVNVGLVEQIPPELWTAAIPGLPNRTVRMIAAHLHNARCRWIKTLGREHGIVAPARVDQRTVTRRQLAAALRRSSEGIAAILELGLDNGGVVPESRGYAWRNLPLDVGHVLAYFVAHEAHHRGQVVMAARQLGQRLPRTLSNDLWQWTRLAKESVPTRRPQPRTTKRKRA